MSICLDISSKTVYIILKFIENQINFRLLTRAKKVVLAIKELNIGIWSTFWIWYKRPEKRHREMVEKKGEDVPRKICRKCLSLPGSRRRSFCIGIKINDGRFVDFLNNTWSESDDIFTLRRKYIEIMLNYNQTEIPTIEQLNKAAKGINIRLNTPHAQQQHITQKIQKDLQGILNSLAFVRNEFKVEARDKIKESLPQEVDGRLVFLDKKNVKTLQWSAPKLLPQ